MKRTIAVITSSRADYSHLFWPLRDLESHPEVDLKLIVMASHLSPEFGSTVQQIEADGFDIAARVECLLSSDTDVGMAKSIGIAVLSLADILGRIRPDLLLIIADRYEMLAPAAAALALRIPIAHIEGGELSEGAIDDAVRNALTKMSHLHFTSTSKARDRVIDMGEEPWRVHHAGAPSLDHLRRSVLPSRQELERAHDLDLTQPSVVISYHPVTLLSDTLAEADNLFKALDHVEGQLLFCYPNADAGSRALILKTETYLQRHERSRIFVNLPAPDYWSLLRWVEALVGNSSSGIMESASFDLPTVNVGFRQHGRERPRNVLDASPDVYSIVSALKQAKSSRFRQSIAGLQNPYGDGRASERIVAVLSQLPSREKLLHKRSSVIEND